TTTLNLNGPLVQDVLGLALRGSLFRRQPSDLSPTGEYGENTTISKRGPSPVRAHNHTFGTRLTYMPTRQHELSVDYDQARQSYENGAAQLGTLDRPDADPPTFNGYGPKQQFNR